MMLNPENMTKMELANELEGCADRSTTAPEALLRAAADALTPSLHKKVVAPRLPGDSRGLIVGAE